MLGLMMDMPLLVSSLLRHAAANHAEVEIVSRTVEGPIHRYTYADAHRRSQQMANALTGLGIGAGDRIGTIAWNGFRHYEVWFGTSGMGAVCHTMNPRLHPDQIAYLLNHAEDRYVFVDLTFLPLIEQAAPRATALEGVVVMTDRVHMPETSLANAICYEELLWGQDDHYDWPVFDENTASSLCYTSGTTGHPKGVLYSHRATVLHSYAAALPNVMCLSDDETVLPVVPMFHANAWGIPYAATMTGAKLVMPGAKLDGESLWQLMHDEGVTFSAGVPTVWHGLLAHMRSKGLRLDAMRRMVIGGSAAPRSMIRAFDQEFGIEARHGWGMTEMSPVGAVNTLKPYLRGRPEPDRMDVLAKQGRPPFGVEMMLRGEDSAPQPHDGKAQGELQVRGPWVCKTYFKGEGADAHRDGWFGTGDVATIDPDGYMQIVDRQKDMIKSGGEWISSIDLEDLAMGHPDVAQAAVIGIAHPKWGERPLLLVTAAPGRTPEKDNVLHFLAGKVAKWWVPDDMVVVDAFPIGGTGKILKTELRALYRDFALP
jgi:acyl-CoA synthetase (AMP-forming)/AMP-acid ligase II